jgi:hypothetical protein
MAVTGRKGDFSAEKAHFQPMYHLLKFRSIVLYRVPHQIKERAIDNRNRPCCTDLQFFWTVQFTLSLIFLKLVLRGSHYAETELYCIHVETRLHSRAYRGRYRPMRMQVVSETYKNYQNGALSNQLTDFGRGRERVRGRVNMLIWWDKLYWDALYTP